MIVRQLEADAGAQPVDVRVLEALVGSEPAVVRDFLQDFRASAARIAAELGVAFEHDQAAQAAALAHELKSSARAVGALALGEVCEEIERAGRAADTESLRASWRRFEVEARAVEEYLASL